MRLHHADPAGRADAGGAAQGGARGDAALAPGLLVRRAGLAGLDDAASFLAAWLYFELLDRTDNRAQRKLHWLILIAGFCGLTASRLIDIRVYGVTF